MANPTGLLETIASTRQVRIDTDLSAKQNYLVTLDTTDDGVVNLAAAATAPLFVLIEGTKGSVTESMGTIALPGSIVKVESGGGISAGDKITSDSNGKGVATTTDKNHVAGIAFENATSGDTFLMIVAPSQVSNT
jgi:hypothetical protein